MESWRVILPTLHVETLFTDHRELVVMQVGLVKPVLAPEETHWPGSIRFLWAGPGKDS